MKKNGDTPSATLIHAYGCDLNYIGHSILQSTIRYMYIFLLIVGACDRCHVYESLNFHKAVS